jgi:hypothetical protein
VQRRYSILKFTMGSTTMMKKVDFQQAGLTIAQETLLLACALAALPAEILKFTSTKLGEASSKTRLKRNAKEEGFNIDTSTCSSILKSVYDIYKGRILSVSKKMVGSTPSQAAIQTIDENLDSSEKAATTSSSVAAVA